VSIATTSNWKDKTSGERREETEWHRVVFYNRLAEIAGEYLRKGRPVYVEGRLKTRKWQNKEGVDQYTTEVIADQMQMLGGRDGAEGGSMGGGEGAPRPAARAPQAQRPAAPAAGGANLADMDDDIPF
jgi:single-strand DNA-binding protein